MLGKSDLKKKKKKKKMQNGILLSEKGKVGGERMNVQLQLLKLMTTIKINQRVMIEASYLSQ